MTEKRHERREEGRKNAKEVLKKVTKGKDGVDIGTLTDGAKDMPRFSSGSLLLDRAIGGGYPHGRVIEIYGPESSGKTTLALEAIRQVQDEGGVAAFIDVEHALDPHYAEAIGVDIDSLLISQPSSGEEAGAILNRLCEVGGTRLVVLDSVAAMAPKAEIEGEVGDSHVGLQARLMGQILRKASHLAAKNGTTVIFLNQIRMKIGVMFGSPETTPGGRALKFFSSIRLDIRRIGSNKKDGETIDNKVRIYSKKNKTYIPFRKAETRIRFGEGLDRVGEIIDLAIEYGIIDKRGSWYYLIRDQDYAAELTGKDVADLEEDDFKINLGQGEDAVREAFEENEDMWHEVESGVLLAYQKKMDDEMKAKNKAVKDAA